jgi:hypothetical protein
VVALCDAGQAGPIAERAGAPLLAVVGGPS